MRRNKILLSLSMAVLLSLLAIILPAVTVLGLQGTISIYPPSGVVGTLVSLTGTGFTPNSTFAVTYESASMPGGTVSATGTLSTTFNIPASGRGAHNISVTTSAGDTLTAPVTFTITPDLVVSPGSGFGGDQISVSGNGFAVSALVTITFDGVTIGSATAGTNGSFAGVSMTIPQTYRGNHSIIASDGVGPSQAYTFSISPRITLSPPSVAIGAPVSIAGTGFTASSPVSFYIDEVNIPTAATSTSSTGSFNASITIPAVSYGSHVLKAMDSAGGSATANFSTTQSMTVNPKSGNAGTSVQITGQGFGANKPITITFKGVNVQTNPPTITSDAGGNFSASLIVPAVGGGAHAILASDGTISSTDNFTIEVKVSPPSIDKGPVGTSATISGTGFVATGNVMVRWDATQLAQGTPNSSGEASITFKVPQSKAGAHTITITDGVTTKTFTFTVIASATLGQTTGNIGSDIPMSGNGFNAGASVTVTYDGNKVAGTNADANGNFTAIFKAPVSKGGSHTVTATDGTNTINSTFTMETTPPTVPLLIKPLDNTKGEQLQDFIWTGVSDPSGVTYVFQLATDSNFNAIVLEKKDMTNPGFKITELEKLKSRSQQEPYFWRVKAIDGASNDSGWSTVFKFNVGFVMPQWGWYGVYAVGAIIMWLFGFFIGRMGGGGGGGGGGRGGGRRMKDSIIF